MAKQSSGTAVAREEQVQRVRSADEGDALVRRLRALEAEGVSLSTALTKVCDESALLTTQLAALQEKLSQLTRQPLRETSVLQSLFMPEKTGWFGGSKTAAREQLEQLSSALQAEFLDYKANHASSNDEVQTLMTALHTAYANTQQLGSLVDEQQKLMSSGPFAVVVRIEDAAANNNNSKKTTTTNNNDADAARRSSSSSKADNDDADAAIVTATLRAQLRDAQAEAQAARTEAARLQRELQSAKTATAAAATTTKTDAAQEQQQQQQQHALQLQTLKDENGRLQRELQQLRDALVAEERLHQMKKHESDALMQRLDSAQRQHSEAVAQLQQQLASARGQRAGAHEGDGGGGNNSSATRESRECAQCAARLAQLQTVQQELQLTRTQLREALSQHEQHAAAAQGKLLEVQAQVAERNARLGRSVSEDVHAALRREKETLAHELQLCRGRVAHLEQTLSTRNERDSNNNTTANKSSSSSNNSVSTATRVGAGGNADEVPEAEALLELLARHKERIARVEFDRTQLQTRVTELQAAVASRDGDVQRLERAAAEDKQRVAFLLKKTATTAGELRVACGERDALQEQLAHVRAELQQSRRVGEQLTALQQRHEELSKEKTQLEARLAGTHALEEKLVQAKETIAYMELAQSKTTMNASQYAALQAEKDKLEHRVAPLQRQLDEANKQLERLRAVTDAQQAVASSQKSDVQGWQETLTTLRASEAKLRERLAHTTADRDRLQQLCNTLETQMNDMQAGIKEMAVQMERAREQARAAAEAAAAKELSELRTQLQRTEAMLRTYEQAATATTVAATLPAAAATTTTAGGGGGAAAGADTLTTTTTTTGSTTGDGGKDDNNKSSSSSSGNNKSATTAGAIVVVAEAVHRAVQQERDAALEEVRKRQGDCEKLKSEIRIYRQTIADLESENEEHVREVERLQEHHTRERGALEERLATEQKRVAELTLRLTTAQDAVTAAQRRADDADAALRTAADRETASRRAFESRCRAEEALRGEVAQLRDEVAELRARAAAATHTKDAQDSNGSHTDTKDGGGGDDGENAAALVVAPVAGPLVVRHTAAPPTGATPPATPLISQQGSSNNGDSSSHRSGAPPPPPPAAAATVAQLQQRVTELQALMAAQRDGFGVAMNKAAADADAYQERIHTLEQQLAEAKAAAAAAGALTGSNNNNNNNNKSTDAQQQQHVDVANNNNNNVDDDTTRQANATTAVTTATPVRRVRRVKRRRAAPLLRQLSITDAEHDNKDAADADRTVRNNNNKSGSNSDDNDDEAALAATARPGVAAMPPRIRATAPARDAAAAHDDKTKEHDDSNNDDDDDAATVAQLRAALARAQHELTVLRAENVAAKRTMATLTSELQQVRAQLLALQAQQQQQQHDKGDGDDASKEDKSGSNSGGNDGGNGNNNSSNSSSAGATLIAARAATLPPEAEAQLATQRAHIARLRTRLDAALRELAKATAHNNGVGDVTSTQNKNKSDDDDDAPAAAAATTAPKAVGSYASSEDDNEDDDDVDVPAHALRVAQLRRRVRECEATVAALTQQLVPTKNKLAEYMAVADRLGLRYPFSDELVGVAVLRLRSLRTHGRAVSVPQTTAPHGGKDNSSAAVATQQTPPQTHTPVHSLRPRQPLALSPPPSSSSAATTVAQPSPAAAAATATTTTAAVVDETERHAGALPSVRAPARRVHRRAHHTAAHVDVNEQLSLR